MDKLIHEFYWIHDLLVFWIWVGGFPYLLQYLTVEVMT
jgi:hypothetical protein